MEEVLKFFCLYLINEIVVKYLIRNLRDSKLQYSYKCFHKNVKYFILIKSIQPYFTIIWLNVLILKIIFSISSIYILPKNKIIFKDRVQRLIYF